MKIVKILLKIIALLVGFILILALFVFLNQRYQFRVIPGKELAAYTGENINYPFVDGKFNIASKGPANFSPVPISPSEFETMKLGREVISLNGIWEVEEGSWKHKPDKFEHTCPVPGLIDLSVPAFEKVGESKIQVSLKLLKPSNLFDLVRRKDKLREAFWYRKTFKLDHNKEVVLLKVHRAKYASAVWVNGEKAGENGRLFSPGIYDISSLLKEAGQENELVIRVGADTRFGRFNNIQGDALEQVRYLPGIYDNVEIICSGQIHIEKSQVVPNISDSTARVLAWIKNYGDHRLSTGVNFTITDYYNENAIHGSVQTKLEIDLAAGEQQIVDVIIPIDSCQLWSPEDPSLYRLHISTNGDSYSTRFGMREFRFDEKSRMPMLNGKPYYLRGTSIPFFRFAEDPERGEKAWDEDWIRSVYDVFKKMNWNQFRFHIGPAPSLWYKVADEEGFLIQDEYAIWTVPFFRMGVPLDTVVSEYVHWMENQWNYPCISIWDAQNESPQNLEPRTGMALKMVRGLDLSDRPWDNGWGEKDRATDTEEQHNYLFLRSMFEISVIKKADSLFDMSTLNQCKPDSILTGEEGHPVLVNEYAWLWVRRDGEPSKFTSGYNKHFPDWTGEQRFEYWARNCAMLTELYRSQRPAGVMQFAGLNSGFPGAGSTDIFLDLDKLTVEPNMLKYLPDAFSPIGLCIYNFGDTIQAGSKPEVPFTLVNDLEQAWEGDIVFRILDKDRVVWQTTKSAGVGEFGKAISSIVINYPERPGWYELVASFYDHNNKVVSSYRKFYIHPAIQISEEF